MKLKVFTVAGSDIIDINYIPQSLMFSDISNVSAIKVSVAGVGVLMNLTSNTEITAVAEFGKISGSSLSALELSDGVILDKNVNIEVTVTGACNVYGSSSELGSVMFKTTEQQVQQNSAQSISDFSAVLMPSSSISDVVTVKNVDTGFSDNLEVQELKALATDHQHSANAQVIGTPMFTEVVFQPNSTQTIVIVTPILA